MNTQIGIQVSYNQINNIKPQKAASALKTLSRKNMLAEIQKAMDSG